MCERKVGTYTREGLLAAVTVFEERTGTDSAEFERRFAAGEVENSFWANVWHQMIGELRRYEGDETLEDAQRMVSHVREMVPERVAA